MEGAYREGSSGAREGHILKDSVRLLPVLVLSASAAMPVPANAQVDVAGANRAYFGCVRRAAEAIEPSGDAPMDVARAAVFYCAREETAAFRAMRGDESQLRESALFAGAAQTTFARLCRRASVCGLAPVPTP